MRTFISINIDDTVKKKLSGIQAELKNKISEISKDSLRAIKWTDKENFHLTLFFIGEVNESRLKEIDNNLSKLEGELSLNEIEFDLKSFNAFPKLRYPRVLMLELHNEDKKVFELSGKINESLKSTGFESDKKFRPHITLGRVKREQKINLTGLDNFIKMDLKFSVKEFYLMESKLKSSGSKYSVLKKYRLSKSV